MRDHRLAARRARAAIKSDASDRRVMALDESDPEAQSEITAFRRVLQYVGWTGGRNVRIVRPLSASSVNAGLRNLCGSCA